MARYRICTMRRSLRLIRFARDPGAHHACAILHLELGPLDLTLLGLNVVLDNCADGPVTVDITAVRGALLGNLLCDLLGHNLINLGATLQDILNVILARLH